MKVTFQFRHHSSRCFLASLAIALMSHAGVSSAQAFQAVKHSTNLNAVYVHEIPESDRVVAQLLIGAGEVDAKGPQGLAHYLEHLVLVDYQIKKGRKPTPHRANAFTSATVTNYVAGGTPNALPTFIRQMANVLEVPSLPAHEMSRERNVVAREYDLNVLQNPRRKAYERIGKLIFQEHPLHRSVIGTRASIAKLQPSEALKFHQAFYKASNATLIVVGKVKAETVRRLVDQAFAHFKSSPKPDRPWQSQGSWESRHITINMADDDAKTSAVEWRALVDVREWDRRKLLSAAQLLTAVINSALPGGLEGPLYNDSYIFNGFRFHLRLLPGGFAEALFSGFTPRDTELAKAVDAYRDAIEQIAHTGLPEKSINRIRRRLTKRAKRHQVRVGAHVQRALFWVINDVPPPSLIEEEKLRAAVSKPDLDRLMRAVASPIRSATALVEQGTKGEN